MLAGSLWLRIQGSSFMRSDRTAGQRQTNWPYNSKQGPLGHSRDASNSRSEGGGVGKHQVVSFPSQEGGWESQFTELIFTELPCFQLQAPPLADVSKLRAPLIQYTEIKSPVCRTDGTAAAAAAAGGWGRKENPAV